MVSILLTLNALICVALVLIILLQRSDPASGGMFGGTGGGGGAVVRNPLAKPTAILAALFLLFSVITAVLNKGGSHSETVMDAAPADSQPLLPGANLEPVAPAAMPVGEAPAVAPAEAPVTAPVGTPTSTPTSATE